MLHGPPHEPSRPGAGRDLHAGADLPAAAGESGHLVQFREDDRLIESVAGVLARPLADGGSALLIATPEHRALAERDLARLGVDLAAVAAEGRLEALDAATTLQAILTPAGPCPERFGAVVGAAVQRLAERAAPVRAFGEMIWLLCRDEAWDEACALEELWTDLERSYPVSLVCNYPVAQLRGGRRSPEEGDADAVEPASGARTIGAMQRRVLTLQAEVDRRRRAERELLDFLDNALEAVHSFDADGTILWANKAELALLGYRPEEYIGHSVGEFHEDLDAIDAILSRLREGADVVNQAARLRCKSGEIRDVLIHANGFYEDGRLVYTRAFTRDVTELKTAERDSALLAAIIQSSDDAIVSKTLDGVITSWNRGAERLFGYRADEVIGHPITILMPEGRPPEEPEIMARIHRGETLETYETVRRRKDGSLIDVALTVSPVRDASGRVVGASKIARDITERKRTEERLRESEETYRRLASLLPVGVCTCLAPHGEITYYNEQAVQLWGRAPRIGDPDERFCGSHALLLPDGVTALPHAESPMAVALREGRAFRNEEIIIERPDGTRITALVNIDPIRDAEGNLVGAIDVFHDITAIKQAELAVLQQKQELQTLLETLPVAVFLAHDPQCRRITGNRAGGRLLRMAEDANFSHTAPPGEAPAHFRCTRYGRLVRPEDLPMQRAARGEMVVTEEIDFQFDDDTTVHTLVSAQPLYDAAGKPRGSVGCILDVTELKRSEAALRDADRRKDEFLAMLAHELRNPLAPILAGLEVMELAKDDAELLQRTRERMHRQAQQLAALVDDLLDVSRITRGKFELRREVVDLGEVVQTALDATMPAIERARHTLHVQLPPEPVRLVADPNRLAQVLSNLLHNAAKYTPPEGRIDLVAERERSHVRIDVRDTGVGIPPEMRDEIFAMFAQIDRPQERGHPGLGIGLTLARSLVEMHRGTISVHSEGQDRGSTFTVRLPLYELSTEEACPGEPPAARDGRAPRRVLVVDDNEAMVDTLSVVMRLLGNDVRTAPDGQTAIEVAEEFRPNVVLMDLGMPRMNGYEAARYIRQQPWGSDIQLIALTGWGQDEHKQRTREAGFDKHLVKPVRTSDLERLFAEA